MSTLCDSWSLEELCLLSEEMSTLLLAKHFPANTIPTFSALSEELANGQQGQEQAGEQASSS